MSLVRKEGFGDRIMRSGHRLGAPWYVKRISRARYVFNMDFRAPRGSIVLSNELLAFGRGYPGHIIVEPNIKGTFSGRNKDWGWPRWQELVDSIDLPWAQFDYGAPLLDSVLPIKTPSFMHGVAVLSTSNGIVTTDGGLHHAAAALRKRAVVIWGGFSPPSVLGYDDHINLYVDAPDCLGMRESNEACSLAMKQITVGHVVNACKIWEISDD